MMLMSNFCINILEAGQRYLVFHFLRFLQAGHHPFFIWSLYARDSDSSYGILNLTDVANIFANSILQSVAMMHLEVIVFNIVLILFIVVSILASIA